MVDAKHMMDSYEADIERLKAALKQAESQAALYRSALEPFAKYADSLGESSLDYDSIDGGPNIDLIPKIGDCRKASEALSTPPGLSDTARLDWLDEAPDQWCNLTGWIGPGTLRKAIDAAIKGDAK